MKAHTLERRSIGLKVRPLLLQNPEMIQELFLLLSQKNIPSVRSQAKAKFFQVLLIKLKEIKQKNPILTS
jgi:hypothetical protein